MSNKKYQVFISSTYTDLIEERKAVEETIIRAGDFPVGMEAFPAADEEQFEFIQTIIDKCDYYVLIIAGRYGSLAPDGRSYTEKEFHYAVDKDIPVLVLLHGDRGSLPVDRSESEKIQRDLLDSFIETVSSGRIRKTWTTVDGLKLAVREALDHAKATKSRPGWVRGDHASSPEILERLVALQAENEQLKKQVNLHSNTLPIENLAGLATPIVVKGRYKQSSMRGSARKMTMKIDTTFGDVFDVLAPHILVSKADELVNRLMAKQMWCIQNDFANSDSNFSYEIEDEIFQTIKYS